jgi:hypothetical protein
MSVIASCQTGATRNRAGLDLYAPGAMVASNDNAAAMLRALRELHAFVANTLSPALQVPGDAMRAAVTIAHFARATATFESILLVAEHGFGSQAMMLNRALVELTVNAWWSRLDDDLTAERYVGWAQLDWRLRREKARKYPDLLGPVDDEQAGLTPEHLNDLQARFGRQGQRGWTGLDVVAGIEALRNAGRGPDPSDLLTFYDVITYASNQELHGSSWSLGRVVRRVPADVGQRVQYNRAPEDELVGPALQFAWWSYSQILELVIGEFDVPVAEPSVDVQKRVLATFGRS